MLITADTENQKRLGLFFLLTIEDKNKNLKKNGGILQNENIKSIILHAGISMIYWKCFEVNFVINWKIRLSLVKLSWKQSASRW